MPHKQKQQINFFKKDQKANATDLFIEKAYNYMQTKQGTAITKEKNGDLAGAKDSLLLALQHYEKLIRDLGYSSKRSSLHPKLAEVTSFYERLRKKFISIPFSKDDCDDGSDLFAAIDASHQNWGGKEDTYANIVKMGSK